MTNPTDNNSTQATSAARFTRLRDLFNSQPSEPRAQKVRQQLLRSRSRNGMLALMLHTCARFKQGLPLSDLETNMLNIVRRCNSDAEIGQFGQIYQQLSATQRRAIFPDELANLSLDTSYTQADFARDLQSMASEMSKQANVRRVDISQLGADGRVPADPDCDRVAEQFGHSIIQFTSPAPTGAAAQQARTSAPEDLVAIVRLNSFVCVKESSEWSNSCEPFFGSGGASDLTGEKEDQTTFRSEIFRDVDKNEIHYFPVNTRVFYGPFNQSVMVELEIWEKDQGDGWMAIRNAMIEMATSCFGGACEMVVTGLYPVAAIFALAGIVASMLAGIFGSCDDDFQVNQSVCWDRNALLALNGQSVTVNYDGGGGTGVFDVRFDIAVSLDPKNAFVPPPPYPFPDAVNPVLVSSATDLAAWMFCVYKAPSKVVGAFNGVTGAMDSVVDNYLHSVVFNWSSANTVDVLSIIAVMGPGAPLVIPQLSTGTTYQGWNGSAWVNGPGTPQNQVYWYRAKVSSVATFFAKTYLQDGVDDMPFSIYAFNDYQVPSAPTLPFPFPDRATPVIAASADDWARQVLGANLPPIKVAGSFDLATSSMSSNAQDGYQVVMAEWGENATVGAMSIIGVVGPGADVVVCGTYGGQPFYQGWNGTSWANDVATPHNGVYWYRSLVTRASMFYAKDYLRAPNTVGRPYTLYAYLDSECLNPPVPPFPFLDVVTPVVADSFDDWAKQVLAINQSPPHLIGNFEAKSKGVISARMDAPNYCYNESIVLDWGSTNTVGRTSILAVMGPGAATVSIEIEAHGNKIAYQGWNGTAWVAGAAKEQSGVFWYRCVIPAAALLRAQTPPVELVTANFIVHAWLAA